MKKSYIKLLSIITIIYYIIGSSVFSHILMLEDIISHNEISSHIENTTIKCHNTEKSTDHCMIIEQSKKCMLGSHKKDFLGIHISFVPQPYNIFNYTSSIFIYDINKNQNKIITQKFLSYADLTGIIISLS